MDQLKTSLYDKSNYKEECSDTFDEIIDSYRTCIESFLIDYAKVYSINESYNTFIIAKGVKCITNVFCMYLYYSNNLAFTEVISNNSLLYFIEFIGQIKQTNLTEFDSKDVLLFVYKKTIFDIVKTKHTYKFMNRLDAIIQIYLQLILNIELKYTQCRKWMDKLKNITDTAYLETIRQEIIIKPGHDSVEELFRHL